MPRGRAAVKALAWQYGIDPRTVRRVLDTVKARGVPAGLEALDAVDLENQEHEQPPADPVVTVDVPGLVAEHLADVTNTEARRALAGGRKIRRGRTTRCGGTAPLTVHRTMIKHSATGLMCSPAGRKAGRIHSVRVASRATVM